MPDLPMPDLPPASHDLNRRRALHWLGGAGLAGLLAACGGSDSDGVDVPPGTPTPSPTPSPSPSPTPTPAPAAAITILADSLGAPIVAPLAQRSGRTVHDWSIGGQTSTQIANRALGVTVTLANPVLAAGANAVRAINGIRIDQTPNGDVSHRILSGADEVHTITGTLAGIRGTLRRTLPGGTETYDFTPADPSFAGTSIADASPFAPDFPAQVVVYLAGRNNYFQYAGHPDYGLDRIVEDARRVIAAFPKVLVLAVTNGDLNVPNEYGPDGGLYLQIQAINQALAGLAGDRFLDHVRIAKDTGLALAGLTPDAQSQLDAQHDVISHQLRRDELHENEAGGDVYAQIILTKLNALGW